MHDSLRRTSQLVGWRCYRADGGQLDDVRRLALALPGTSETPSHDGLPAWRVKDKLFVWERPLRRA